MIPALLSRDAPRPRRWLLAGAAATLVYLLARVPGLASAPVFNDEAIYGLWVAQLLGHPSWTTAFAPWQDDGKVGLFVWAVAGLDALGWPAAWGPVVLWRCGSLLAGLLVLGALMAMAFRATLRMVDPSDPHRERTAIVAALAAGVGYAAWPLAQIHERMALFDAPLTAAWLIAMLAAARLLGGATPSRAGALGLGVAFALPVMVKLSGAPAAVLGPATALWCWRRGRWPADRLLGSLAGTLAPAVLAVVPAWVAGSAHDMMAKHIQWHGSALGGNAAAIAREAALAVWYTTGPIWLLALAGAVGWVRRAGWATASYWLLWTAGPILGLTIIGQPGTIYSRYLLPFLAPVWALVGVGLAATWRARFGAPVRWAWLLFAVAAWGWMSLQAMRWLVSPESMRLTPGDRHQYVDGWPSGRHIPELRTLIDAMAARHAPVEVLTMHPFQNPAVGLAYVYRLQPDRVAIRPVETLEALRRQLLEPPERGCRVWLELGESDSTPEATAGLVLIREWPGSPVPRSPSLRLWATPFDDADAAVR